MHICFVTREYPPITAYSGGIGFQFRTMSVALARRGARVEVITLGAGKAEQLESDGVRVHRLPLPAPARVRMLRDVVWARAIDAAVRTNGPFDAVYAPEWAGEASRYSASQVAGPLITNLTSSARLVLRSSPGWGTSPRLRLRLALQAPLERRQAERSRLLVACSQAILDRLRGAWDIGSVPAVVVPNCIDVSATQRLGEGEPPAGFPADGPVVAFSGRLQQHKGADVLVEGMRRVWQRVPEARLVMLGSDAPAGRGSMADRLVRIAGEHRTRLHLLGNQPPGRLFAALARADVVALPSRWEAFGLAALEAMALGRPLVLTRGTGFEELAGPDAAAFVAPSDPEGVADAIVGLLEAPSERGRLGAAARARAEAFDVGPIAGRHLEVFEAVAGGSAVGYAARG